jgi:DNA repair protein RadC
MNCLKDAAGGYAPVVQQTHFANLINTLLGCNQGTAILSDLVGDDEVVTPQNLRDRLRVAILAGALPQLTPKRLAKLQAAVELGQQLYAEKARVGEVLDDPRKAAAVFDCIAWEPVEKLAIACLDVKARLLSYRVISVGTATETLAHPREIFSTVIQAGATRCIIAHNHPSGSTTPSEGDISLTRQLLQASEVMKIPVLDHLIVSRGEYTSMRQTTSLWTDPL